MASDAPANGAAPSRGPNPWLIPAGILSAIIVVLNAAAWLGLPIASLAPWVVGASVVALLWLVAKIRPTLRGFAAAVGAATCAWLALSDLAGNWIPANYVSAHPDAWSYDALAGYLKDYGRNQTEGMPVVDQFGAHLRNSRFSSSCLLALGKSVLGPANVFLVHAIFLGTTLFVFYCSMAALAGALGLQRGWVHATAAISVLLGWTTNAMLIGNYDNLCFAALLPSAIVLLLRLSESGPHWWRNAAALAVTTAAILYTYPEGAALCGPAILPVLVTLFIQSNQRGAWLVRMATAAFVAILLWLPYASHFVRFLSSQLTPDKNPVGILPGSGNFDGLLSVRWLPSLFALGSEYPAAGASWISYATALALVALLLAGLWQLSGRHLWTWPAAILAVLLLLWQALGKHYDYGAFKVTFCHTWLAVPAVVAGFAALNSRLPRIAGLLVLFALVAGVGTERWRHRGERVWPQTRSSPALAELRKIVSLTGDVPTYLDLSNEFDQMWATSILRDTPLVVLQRRGYLAMPHVKSFLDHAKFLPVNRAGALLLADGPKAGALWQNSRFHLERSPSVLLTGLENPNGSETVGDKPFIWIGHSRDSIIKVHALQAGTYILESAAWWVGPSLPESSRRTLVVTDAEGEHTLAADFAAPQITLHLKEGENSIRLRVAEAPSLPVQANGDRRELMLGMLGYFLKPTTL